MRVLSEQEILSLWERGLRQHPVERGLSMLSIALPEVPRHHLCALSVGQRDACLLDVRERTFGSRFAGFAECRRCRERLEFAFDAANVRIGAASIEPSGQVRQFRIGEYELYARLPNNADLQAIAGQPTPQQARRLLLQRCITRAYHNGNQLEIEALPDDTIAALGEQVLEQDPQAEILLDLSCPGCGHRWSAVFDIVTFLWAEIQAHARRLLRDIHMLATAYGWHEKDILAMSPVRRQMYLEMIS